DSLTRKKSKLEASLNAPIPNIATTISQTSISSSKSLSDLVDLEIDDNAYNAENLNESVQLIFKIELDSKLIESIFSNQQALKS
ncbi:89_t:CDS:2, partial [Racocetra fulgida]